MKKVANITQFCLKRYQNYDFLETRSRISIQLLFFEPSGGKSDAPDIPKSMFEFLVEPRPADCAKRLNEAERMVAEFVQTYDGGATHLKPFVKIPMMRKAFLKKCDT